MGAELIKAVIKSGILGIVLAWALWENSKLVDRVFIVIERNTKAISQFENVCRDRLGALP